MEGEPLLRTLSPALRELERRVRAWLGAARRHSLSTLQQAQLEGLAADLARQADALQLEQPLLIIVLMGGTGVGKSTLLNALAGGTIAQASFQRPTTRDPVVYYHQSIQPHRLDHALQQCRLVSHDRPALENKVIVDTPDLDSNDLSNRDKLFRILPVADIVLYVGSQEKYHDQLGWDLFSSQRQRRGFAFILNKWDRCHVPGASGVRPDQDLLRDLEREGFARPLLFRTCAQHWVDNPRKERNGQPASPPVEGEQFEELVQWLERGISRLEVEAIKARGVSKLLVQMDKGVSDAMPPDLAEAAGRVHAQWKTLLDEEARAQSALLLSTLEPYQREIEHHFAMQRQRKFRGAMASYLHLFNKVRYSGSTLREQIPFLGRGVPASLPRAWDLGMFTQAAAAATSEQHSAARQRALADRLLIAAAADGFPMHLLQGPTEQAARVDWQNRLAQTVLDVLSEVDHSWSQPSGLRKGVQTTVVLIADWLPLAAFGVMGLLLIWQYTMEQRPFAWGDLLLPAIVTLLVLVVMHVAVAIVMPLRWHALRADFAGRLEQRLQGEMARAYNSLPAAIAEDLGRERRQVEALLGEVREVAGWLARREEESSIEGLYATQ